MKGIINSYVLDLMEKSKKTLKLPEVDFQKLVEEKSDAKILFSNYITDPSLVNLSLVLANYQHDFIEKKKADDFESALNVALNFFHKLVFNIYRHKLDSQLVFNTKLEIIKVQVQLVTEIKNHNEKNLEEVKLTYNHSLSYLYNSNMDNKEFGPVLEQNLNLNTHSVNAIMEEIRMINLVSVMFLRNYFSSQNDKTKVLSLIFKLSIKQFNNFLINKNKFLSNKIIELKINILKTHLRLVNLYLVINENPKNILEMVLKIEFLLTKFSEQSLPDPKYTIKILEQIKTIVSNHQSRIQSNLYLNEFFVKITELLIKANENVKVKSLATNIYSLLSPVESKISSSNLIIFTDEFVKLVLIIDEQITCIKQEVKKNLKILTDNPMFATLLKKTSLKLKLFEIIENSDLEIYLIYVLDLFKESKRIFNMDELETVIQGLYSQLMIWFPKIKEKTQFFTIKDSEVKQIADNFKSLESKVNEIKEECKQYSRTKKILQELMERTQKSDSIFILIDDIFPIVQLLIFSITQLALKERNKFYFSLEKQTQELVDKLYFISNHDSRLYVLLMQSKSIRLSNYLLQDNFEVNEFILLLQEIVGLSDVNNFSNRNDLIAVFNVILANSGLLIDCLTHKKYASKFYSILELYFKIQLELLIHLTKLEPEFYLVHDGYLSKLYIENLRNIIISLLFCHGPVLCRDNNNFNGTIKLILLMLIDFIKKNSMLPLNEEQEASIFKPLSEFLKKLPALRKYWIWKYIKEITELFALASKSPKTKLYREFILSNPLEQILGLRDTDLELKDEKEDQFVKLLPDVKNVFIKSASFFDRITSKTLNLKFKKSSGCTFEEMRTAINYFNQNFEMKKIEIDNIEKSKAFIILFKIQQGIEDFTVDNDLFAYRQDSLNILENLIKIFIPQEINRYQLKIYIFHISNYLSNQSIDIEKIFLHIKNLLISDFESENEQVINCLNSTFKKLLNAKFSPTTSSHSYLQIINEIYLKLKEYGLENSIYELSNLTKSWYPEKETYVNFPELNSFLFPSFTSESIGIRQDLSDEIKNEIKSSGVEISKNSAEDKSQLEEMEAKFKKLEEKYRKLEKKSEKQLLVIKKKDVRIESIYTQLSQRNSQHQSMESKLNSEIKKYKNQLDKSKQKNNQLTNSYESRIAELTTNLRIESERNQEILKLEEKKRNDLELSHQVRIREKDQLISSLQRENENIEFLRDKLEILENKSERAAFSSKQEKETYQKEIKLMKTKINELETELKIIKTKHKKEIQDLSKMSIQSNQSADRVAFEASKVAFESFIESLKCRIKELENQLLTLQFTGNSDSRLFTLTTREISVMQTTYNFDFS